MYGGYAPRSTKPILYWNKICPFVQRSWIAAIEKNVDVELEYISLSNMPQWYIEEVNSRETVPALKLTDGKVLLESMFIAQYFDENYGIKNQLQAGSAVDKHRGEIFIQNFGEAIGQMYGLLMSQDADGRPAAMKKLDVTLNDIEAALAKASNGPYFFGSDFSMVDIAMVPFLDRFRFTLAVYRGYKIFDGRPRLQALHAAALKRPSVASTVQPGQFYINAYKGYAQTEPLSTLKDTLYYNEICPFADRTRLANALKGSPFEEVSVELPVPEWYSKEINPLQQVPAIKLHDGTTLADSIPLVRFIDNYSTSIDDEFLSTASGNTLMPADSEDKYDTRFLLDEFEQSSDSFWASMSGKNEEAIKQTIANLGYLNGYYEKKTMEGPFFLGEKPTYADVVLLPFWVRVQGLYEVVLKKYNDNKEFEQAYPRIAVSVYAARADERLAKVLGTKEQYVAYVEKQQE